MYVCVYCNSSKSCVCVCVCNVDSRCNGKKKAEECRCSDVKRRRKLIMLLHNLFFLIKIPTCKKKKKTLIPKYFLKGKLNLTERRARLLAHRLPRDIKEKKVFKHLKFVHPEDSNDVSNFSFLVSVEEKRRRLTHKKERKMLKCARDEKVLKDAKIIM